MHQKPFVILLAGGENSRFFPLNTGTHKGGRSIAGTSLINRCVNDLFAHNFTTIRVVVSEKDYGGKGLSDTLEKDVEFVLQPEPRGQADAIILATADLEGDVIVASPYYLNAGAIAQQLLEKQEATQAECVVLASETTEPTLYGMLQLEEDTLTGIVEKSEEHTTSTTKANSFYYFNRSFLQQLATTQVSQYSLEQSLHQFAQEHSVKIVRTEEQWPSLKFAWQLLEFTEIVLSQQTSQRHPSAQIAANTVIDETKGAVVIAEGAIIKDFVTISGPAYIGKNVLIGEYSFIRGSSIEAECQVGANTEIVRSLLLPEVTIHAGYCADSILGDKSTVGAGLITANLRLDGTQVHAMVSEKKRATNKRKMGVITGENVRLGVRVTTMPGTLIGANSTIYPGLLLSHSIENDSIKKV